MKTQIRKQLSGVAAVVAAGLVLSVGTMRAADVTSDSDTLEIEGVVEVYTAIAVAPKAAAEFTLGFDEGLVKTSVATVTETSNKYDGYDVTVQSANRASGAANLKNSADDLIAYSVFYNGSEVAVNLSGTDAVNITNSSAPTGASGVENDVQIEIASGYKVSGTYTDTLTFSIASK